jgi:hypothetical protein
MNFIYAEDNFAWNNGTKVLTWYPQPLIIENTSNSSEKSQKKRYYLEQ